MMLCPITLRDANQFIYTHHRHHGLVSGYKFAIGCKQGDVLCGVAVVGRPVSRHLDNGATAEVTRLCADGTANACSFLYGAAVRAARAMGYQRLITYTLLDEHGASLKATGFVLDGITSDRKSTRLNSSH